MLKHTHTHTHTRTHTHTQTHSLFSTASGLPCVLQPIRDLPDVRGQRSDGGLLVVFEVRCAELPSHPGRGGEAPTPLWWPRPQQHVSRRGQDPGSRQAVVVGVSSWLEWCIVGVEVWMVMVLMVLVLIIVEASVSVPPSPSSSSSSSPPSSLPSWPGRHPPPLPWSPLVTAASMMLVIVIVTVAMGGAVQRVAAVAALVVLVVALVVVVEAALVALVALLPRTMRAGRAHARGWWLEGEGQESRQVTLRRRRR